MTATELPGELPFDLGAHDVRIERGEWVYFVRGVKSYEPLRVDLFAGSGFGEAIVAMFVVQILDFWWSRRKAWKVGVLRVKGSRWGPSGRLVVLHKERLSPGVAPGARTAQLAEDVVAGRFDAP